MIRMFPACRCAALLLLLLTAASVRAQTYDMGSQRQPMVSLDGPWHFHPGDSPTTADGKLAWAQPGFDDAGWATIRGGKPWSYQGYASMGGWAWYRFAVRIPATEGGTSLLLAPIMTGYELYVDGRLGGRRGNIPPNYTPNTDVRYYVYPLVEAASPSQRTVTVAIRVWHSPLWQGYVGGGSFSPGNLAGDPELLNAEALHQSVARNARLVDWYCYSIASGLIGFAILGLFWMRPVEREYLAFAIMLLAQCADCIATLLLQIWSIPAIPIFDVIDGELNAAVFVASLYFIARILAVPVGRRGWVLAGMAAMSGLAAGLYWPGLLSVPESAAVQLLLLLPVIFWAIYLLVRSAIRGNRDARLLLLPILLASGYYAVDNLIILLSQAGIMGRPAWMERSLPLPPFSIHIQVMLDLVFLLAMLVFLIRRFSMARKREERMAGEFEAARQIQQVLFPEEPEPCPGFKVESVYRPAEQVGGDFFQQIPDGDGGLLIVVGDVSGKGLPAAMVVSVMVGAMRAEAAHSVDPAAMLEALNARAMGRSHGGFVTCLAAHIGRGGMARLAGAGHLSPYLNGAEVEMPPSLPLGLIEGVRYEAMTLQLRQGDRLTFVSDGVVEAQKPGGEMLGFAGTQALVGLTAERMADAAVAFGQEDDITVVTVEYCGLVCEGAPDSEAMRQVAS